MIADRDPLDELDELLFGTVPESVSASAAASAVPPHVVPATPIEPAAALAQIPMVPVADAPAVPSAQLKRLVGSLAIDVASLLKGCVDRGEFDADDLMNLLPKLQKVMVDEAKLEIARNDGGENLPILYVTIGSAGQIRADCKPLPHIEVVEAVGVVERVPQGEAPAPAHAWSVDFQPIDAGGAS